VKQSPRLRAIARRSSLHRPQGGVPKQSPYSDNLLAREIVSFKKGIATPLKEHQRPAMTQNDFWTVGKAIKGGAA
jgi:hypothetical protein